MYNHQTIKKYTAGLLELFNDVSVNYTLSDGQLVSKKIPIKFSTREKIYDYSKEDLSSIKSGNYNFLPRGSLVFNGLQKGEHRQLNRNIKTNLHKTESKLEYAYSSVSYDFNFDVVYICRGMNEMCQIIECVAPLFNPTVAISVWDAENLNKKTNIRVNLENIETETQSYEEYSFNLFKVVFSLRLLGNLYQPIKEVERVKEYILTLDITKNMEQSTQISLFDFDVINGKPEFLIHDTLVDMEGNPLTFDEVVNNANK